MAERRHRFTIASNQEEFSCPTCGCPLYVGDRAVLIQSDTIGEYVSCSWSCHTVELRDRERVDALHSDGSWAP